MSEPIPTDPEAPEEEPIPVDPDFPPEDPVPPEQEPVEPGPELPIVGGWLDAAAQAEADAKAYTDEQVPLVAGRMVPRNMDRAPTVEDGTDLIAGTGWNQYDPVTNDLVQMWRWDGTAWQALDMAAGMIPVLDIGSATVGDLTGGRINVQGGPIVAGDPAGARVEIAGDGLHAYDATGVETARIIGEEGVFVGGEFRTSDALPGQVTLSDTAAEGGPGIGITPASATGYTALPWIGPSGGGAAVNGGTNSAGDSSRLDVTPTVSSLNAQSGTGGYASVLAGANSASVRQEGADGTSGVIGARPGFVVMEHRRADGALSGRVSADTMGSRVLAHRADGSRAGAVEATDTTATVSVRDAAGTTRGSMEVSETGATSRSFSGNASESGWVRARPQDAELAYVDANNTYFSRIKADASEASLYTRAGGTSRYLTVDANGVWVKTNKSGSWKQYNLEETAQDSGWQSLTLASGLSGSWSPAWRNKGGVIYLRGRVTKTGNWTAGWNVLVPDVGPDARPASHIQRAGATRGVGGTFLEVTTGGVLQVWFDTSAPGSTAVELSPMFYPLG